jgi:hypothetical protein
MEGKAYPPTKRFRELTRQEKRERMETSADLLNVLQWNRGDPRLSAWEEQFLTSMVRHIQTFHGAAKITPPQWDKIHEILDMLDKEPPDLEEEAEADC